MPTTASEIRVRYAETDQMGVAYHANYLVWCEIGRTDFIREHVMSYAEMERRGALLAVSDATIRFHAAAVYEDVVRVTTTLVGVRSRAVEFDYAIARAADGEKLATANTRLIVLSRDRRPAVLPEDIRAALEAVSVEGR